MTSCSPPRLLSAGVLSLGSSEEHLILTKRVFEPLAAGQPISILAIGSSITKGSGGCSSPLGVQAPSRCEGASGQGFARALLDSLNATHPHAGHRLFNAGASGAALGSSWECLETGGATIDLLLLEHVSVSARELSSEAEAAAVTEIRQATRSLRAALRAPAPRGAPAAVALLFANWHEAKGKLSRADARAAHDLSLRALKPMGLPVASPFASLALAGFESRPWASLQRAATGAAEGAGCGACSSAVACHNPALLTLDGLHPNPRGAAFVGELLVATFHRLHPRGGLPPLPPRGGNHPVEPHRFLPAAAAAAATATATATTATATPPQQPAADDDDPTPPLSVRACYHLDASLLRNDDDEARSPHWAAAARALRHDAQQAAALKTLRRTPRSPIGLGKPARIVRNDGFAATVVEPAGRERFKPGFSASRAGAAITFDVSQNTSSSVSASATTTATTSRGSYVAVHHLVSYDDAMGTARVSCAGGCSCAEHTLDGRSRHMASQQHAARLRIEGGLERCTITVTAVGDGRFKLDRVVVGEGLGAGGRLTLSGR